MNMLAFSKAKYQAIKQRLAADHPGLDEETLADTVEGLTDLHDIVAAIVRAAITDEALAQGLRGRISEMQARLARFEDRALSRRSVARDVMVEAEIKKITASDLTISIRPGTPSVQVLDETIVPAAYWVTPAPRLDRQGLGADLKRGLVIAGVSLATSQPILSVRAK